MTLEQQLHNSATHLPYGPDPACPVCARTRFVILRHDAAHALKLAVNGDGTNGDKIEAAITIIDDYLTVKFKLQNDAGVQL
jgi:hypothetical protein